jgi:hypothetical protein
MHRSGTSAFARVFSLLGARLPDNLLTPEDTQGNPLGFWEPKRIVELHDQLLTAAARTWFDLEPFPREWFHSDLAQSYVGRLAAVVREEYAQSPLFVLKDPRISRLVPLWESVFDRVGVRPHFVIALRNPLEIAASHRDRDSFRSPLSLLLWLRHMLDAERDTRGHRRVVAAYPDLLDDWQTVVGKVAVELDLRWTRTSRASALEIDGFLRRDARHHVVSDAELERRRDVSPWVRDAYRAFRRLAECEEEGDLHALDAIRAELDKSEEAWGAVLFDAVHRLRAERERSSEELSQLRAEAAALADEVTRQDAALEEAHKRLELSNAEARPAKEEARRLKAMIAELESAMTTLESERERLAGEAGLLASDLADRETALAQAERRLAETTKKLEANQLKLDQTTKAAEQLREENAAAAARLTDESARLASALTDRNAALAATQSARSEAEKRLGEVSARLAERDTAVVCAEKEALRLTQEVALRAAELDEQAAELVRRKTTIEGLWLNNGRLAERLAKKERELSLKSEEQELLAAAHESAQAQLDALGRDSRTLAALLAGGRIGTARARSRAQLRSWILHGRLVLVLEYLRARRSAEIDGVAYLLRYEDVARAGVSPLMHYVEYGRLEGRDAHPFDGERATASGEKISGKAPRRNSLSQFAGWIVRGRIRLVEAYVRMRRSGTFNVPAYLSANPDVAAARIDPLMHYVEHGRREGRALRSVPPHHEVSAAAALDPAQTRWQSAVSLVLERLQATDSIFLVHAGAEDDIDLGRRRGWRATADTHPEQLVAEIENARGDGATHVLVTARAISVLDSQHGLSDFLSRRTRLIMRRNEDCALFFFHDIPHSPSVEEDLVEIVSALVPRNQALVVIGSPALSGWHQVWHIPAVQPNGVVTQSLDEFRAKGARYLVIAATELNAFEQHDDLRTHVERHYKTVLRREGVGVLYEAVEATAAAASES